MWRELGAVQGRRFHYHSEILHLVGKDREFDFRTDAGEVERQRLRISPKDEGLIRQFIELISGRSLMVVFDIAQRFKDLGGELRCRSQVADVIVENDRAAGVVLESGEELRADTVIWAADGHHLIFDLLKGRYMDETIRKMYETWVPTRPLVHVALGVARDLSNLPAKTCFELEEPITIGGHRHRWIVALHHGFDPTMAPPGKTAVEVWYPTRYDYWEDLATRPGDYAAEKDRIAKVTIEKLEKQWPGFSSDVEVVDVPTPVTYTRYTGNWQGSPDGWYITPQNSRDTPVRRLPGLSNLMTIGQWTAPFTGTVLAALTGRQAVELLCHHDKRPFQTTEYETTNPTCREPGSATDPGTPTRKKPGRDRAGCRIIGAIAALKRVVGGSVKSKRRK